MDGGPGLRVLSERTLRLTVEYDGTDFSGWQIQDKQRTVQGVLEEAIRAMTAEPTRVRGAGRTDAGVHARGQVAAFSTATTIPALGFLRGINAILPRDVAVVAAAEAEPGFDPRRLARGKIYRYTFWNHPIRSPIHERWSWHIRAPLDVDSMTAAGALLVGEHDFSAFRAADCERTNTVRVMRRVEVARRGPLVDLDVEATAFLKNMVRVIAGTLYAVGRGETTPEEVGRILLSRDRTRAGMTAPAQGLCLLEVLFSPT